MHPTINDQSSHGTATKTTTPHRTLYDILGVTMEDCTITIKRKYRELAKQTHPDMLLHNRLRQQQQQQHCCTVASTSDDDDVGINFTEIAAAYAILSDPVQRRKYDRQIMADQWITLISDVAEGCVSIVTVVLRIMMMMTWTLILYTTETEDGTDEYLIGTTTGNSYSYRRESFWEESEYWFATMNH